MPLPASKDSKKKPSKTKILGTVHLNTHVYTVQPQIICQAKQ